ATALGDEALATRGEWMTHSETLTGYVRMLRVASKPRDAYQHLCAHASEITRVGSYAVEELAPNKLRITYTKRPDSDADQKHPLLCLARRAELASLPRIWGLPEAVVSDPQCIARGDKRCIYELAWAEPSHKRDAPAGALLGGV